MFIVIEFGVEMGENIRVFEGVFVFPTIDDIEIICRGVNFFGVEHVLDDIVKFYLIFNFSRKYIFHNHDQPKISFLHQTFSKT